MFDFVEKSGTGIGKSGTGIEKSGTGIARLSVTLVAFAVGLMMGGTALASDSRLAVSTNNDRAVISVHAEGEVMIGVAAAPLDASGYARIPLYSVLRASDQSFSMGLLVQGSGSGSAGESTAPRTFGTLVQGSGSGSAKESAGTGGQLLVQGSGSGDAQESVGTGGQLLVQGSGSGDAQESVRTGGQLLVQGSGSGDAQESVGTGGQLLVQGSGSGNAGEHCGGGPSLLVQGSGSGSAGESAGCASEMDAWGFAEVVVDRSGTHVLIHEFKGGRAEEHLVAFLPVSNGEVAHSLYRGSSNHGFVAAP